MSSVFVATTGDAQFAMNPMSSDTLSKSLLPFTPDTTLPHKMNSFFVATTGGAQSAMNPISLDALSNSTRSIASTTGSLSSLSPSSTFGSLTSESMAAQNLPEPQAAASLRQSIAKDDIQLVSLGCACAIKMAFKEMGRGAETLPFDWIT